MGTSTTLRRLTLLLAALALSLGARPAAARAAESPLACPGAELRAGQLVELRWSALPRDAEEMEILLSVDGGRHFAVRISPELDPREGRFLWRVPNLPAASARLVIRIGRGPAEVATEPTAPFRILGDATAPRDLDQVHEGPWWSGAGAGGRDAAPDELSAAGASLTGGGRAAEPLEAPQRPQADAVRGARIDASPVARPDATFPHTPRRSSAPLFFPLRN
ncbi:MAG: hypothetical protein HZC42_09010 [Candidatus Eisenbacteria bacterium]|nr:hypothetical protein [Candidatus Eisenbacteria bacterium]